MPRHASVGSEQASQVSKRRPIPRKGHRKSRAGCAVCKTRKVKCDETAPTCGPCQRLGLECRYLGIDKQAQALAGVRSSLGAPSSPLRTEPAVFNGDDLRFFHQFLFSAYPSLPIGGWKVWQAAGQMAHHYEFLVHSMLGLGASHLGLLSGVDYARAAMKHRVLAIQTLNQHLSKPKLSMADADAAFAAMLTLTFQSAYLPDGMVDFFTMVRGCFVIGMTVIPDFEDSAFQSIARADYVDKVKELIYTDGPGSYLNSSITQGFCTSLGKLRLLCTSAADLEYLSRMHSITIAAATNPAESCHEHSFLYEKLGELSPSDFTAMIDPTNSVSRLMIMHMLVLDFVMSRKEVEDGGTVRKHDPTLKGYDTRKSMALRWIENIWAELPEAYREYAEWPRNFAKGLRLSFGKEDDIWLPFRLHDGIAIISNSLLLEPTRLLGE